MGGWGARHGRAVTHAVRAPVRPATRWIRVVSMASARVIAGRMVVSRRASIDLAAPGGPGKGRLWAQRPHERQVHMALLMWLRTFCQHVLIYGRRHAHSPARGLVNVQEWSR